jgi:enoyl-CoA hydratase
VGYIACGSDQARDHCPGKETLGLVLENAEHKYLHFANEGKILIVSINNPPHNYLPSAIFEEFRTCRNLLTSPDTGAIVITAQGNVFSKGADIAELKSGSLSVDKEVLVLGNEILSFIANLNKPVIAAIDGLCLGAGLELALACHIRICSERTRLGLPELSIGLIPGLGGIQRLIRVVGEAKALEMILLGDIISASQALELNLVNRVYPKVDFFPRVLLFVKTLLATRKEAIEAVLELVTRSRSQEEEESIRRAAERFARLLPRRGL